jgi:hypothetical protein
MAGAMPGAMRSVASAAIPAIALIDLSFMPQHR